MKLFLKILKYARPIEKYAIPYFIFVLIYAVFNMFNFVLIIPILDTLFKGIDASVAVTSAPDFAFSTSFIQDYINYVLIKYYGNGALNIRDVLIALSVLIVTSMFISNLFRFLAQKTMANFKINMLQRLRDTLFSNIMRLNVRFFTNERKGDILSKLTSDIIIVQSTATNALQVIFKEPMLIIAYFVALISISWQLTIFTLLFMPISAGAIGFIVKRLRHYANNAQEHLGEMLSISEEALSGMKVIKSYGIAKYIISRFVEKDTSYSKIMRKIETRQQLASPMSEFLGVATVAVILIYGGQLVSEGSLDASAFMAYIAMFSQVTRPMRTFVDSLSGIHQGLAAGERVMELIDMEPEIQQDNNAIKITNFKNSINFEDIQFSYESKPVIKGISIEVKKGETIALVGASGSGKSTLADLLSRFYDVQGGTIKIDGVDIKNYELDSLRDVIGTVSQDVLLFNDTIEQNIKLGRLDATTEEVIEAAKIANAHEFIKETENGYKTNIGDRGMKLSGGQRQRISIARAVLKNPDILILDEATSALDTQSEKIVQDALDSLLKNRTSIVVAHRLSTIKNADKIYVIDEGKVVEHGSHEELVNIDGYYKKLIDMQTLNS
ncbi:MAG: ABC transporter ATP-binding protein [Bacteroidetes bacterium]|nr:ABC transporter ATP-binding protein [Bacteroidota bacterium]